MPWHSPRVRYSLHLGTKVNTPFFQVPTLEFGHGAASNSWQSPYRLPDMLSHIPCAVPVLDLVLGTKVSTGSVCVHRDVTSEAVQCFILAFSSCFKWRLTRRDGVSMYTVTLNTVLRV